MAGSLYLHAIRTNENGSISGAPADEGTADFHRFVAELNYDVLVMADLLPIVHATLLMVRLPGSSPSACASGVHLAHADHHEGAITILSEIG